MGNKNIYIGNLEADKIYVGNTEVDKIYVGNFLVWQNVIPWTLTIQINNYVATATYSINGGVSVTVSSNTTLTLTDADTVVVTGNKPSDTAQYSYGSVTGGGTFSYNGSPTQTCSLSCTRTLKSYTITFTGTYCSWGSSSKTAYYGDTLSVSGTTVTCSGTANWTNTVTKYTNTAKYSYGTPSISNGTGTITGARTVKGTSSRTLRSYTVSFGYKSPSTKYGFGYWNNSASITVNYGTTISISGQSVTIGSTTRTFYANGTSVTNPDWYRFDGIETSTGGTTVTGDMSINGLATAQPRGYGILFKVTYLYANPLYRYQFKNEGVSGKASDSVSWSASVYYNQQSGTLGANSTYEHATGYSSVAFSVTLTFHGQTYTLNVPAKGSAQVHLYY